MADEIKVETPVVAEAKPEVKPEIKPEVKPEVKTEGKKTDKKDEKKPFVRKPRAPQDGFIEKMVDVKPVNKTTKGGRNMRFSVLVVIGDKKGQVGFGMGKSKEIPNAIKKANKNARNNITKVTMNKRGTLYHEVVGKANAAKVLIKPAPEGTGIVAGGAIRAVIELAGFKDVYTKNLGKNTAVNMIRATINGLAAQKTPAFIAEMRDKQVKDL